MGQYISSEIVTGTYVRARLIVDFTPNATNNTSSVSAYVQMWRTNTGYTTNGSGTLHIGIDGYGWWSSSITSSQKITYNSYTQVGSTRSLTITHGADGRWTGNFYVYTSTNVDNITFSQQTFSVTLTPNPVYTLSMSAGTGSSITVNRTYSPVGGTGNLSAGTKKLYYGDTLKVSFSPSANYSITTNTVNGNTFTSGNTHTVIGNVSVVAAATPLKSSVSATNTNIGSVSTIVVTKYNTNYTHSLYYQWGDLSGYIARDGTISPSEVIYSDTTIPFTLPESFYSKIPNNQSGYGSITCTTYNGGTSLGSNSCTFYGYVDENTNSPDVTGSVVDINEITTKLTGDPSIIIKNKSTAVCTIEATSKNYSLITEVKIGGATVSGDWAAPYVYEATKTYHNVSMITFPLYAIDSRKYDTDITLTPTVIDYTTLTCNPMIYRYTPTGSTMAMDISGNWYKGSFGTNGYSNTLTLKYRYKTIDGTYPVTKQALGVYDEDTGEWSSSGIESDENGWITIDTTEVIKSIGGYRSANTLSLFSYPTTDEEGNVTYQGFDYHLNYEFQVEAYDGATIDDVEYKLSSVTQSVSVAKGIPVYDWGENDFNFNVPVMLNNVNILNIMYPVGAVYMHSSSTIPTVLNSVGTWSSVTTGISGVYAWKRTA